MLETLIISKRRVKLLLMFFLNPSLRAYLRGLSEEFGDSSNSLRLELNRLEGAGMLVAEDDRHKVQDTKCLILGFTFKENCPDVRNTRVIDIVQAIKAFHMEPMVYDPWANPEEVMHEYGITVFSELPQADFGAAVLAVANKEFESLNLRALMGNGIIYDVKGVLPKEQVDVRL